MDLPWYYLGFTSLIILLAFKGRDIALHAYTLTIVHPVSQEVMTFVAPPPALWNKRFGDDVMASLVM